LSTLLSGESIKSNYRHVATMMVAT